MHAGEASYDGSVDPKLRDAFGAYLKQGTLESFLAAREVLLSLPSYDPWSTELAEFDRLLEREDWGGIHRTALGVLDNWMLTPYLHECLALAHRRLGDESLCALEAELAAACARGILMTGDGTAERPYLIVRPDDAYGAMLFDGKEWTYEREVSRAGRTLRALTDADGTEHWFELARAARGSPYSAIETDT